ncbi:MAG: 23S rRNA (adenine(2030)-N(6))-methyltransferase RlmJ [Treponema sp.]|nr:23S rRNA (adenine(2030)-N(6))-methyltransferase RlmJ [Treponema sp.]
MLSYQHAFHAGNHADILKHYVLFSVIQALNTKEKPYTLYDTHAGSGLYDMLDNRSLKTNEARSGILTLVQAVKNAGSEPVPQDLTAYLDYVQGYLDKSLYPGSPKIEQDLMRGQDTLILSELHPAEIENLRKNLHDTSIASGSKKSVQIHERSGWEMLKALTPPLTSRGAALIDPSYEEADDYEAAAQTICAVHKKWTNGIIMLWYPLLAHRQEQIQGMKAFIKEFVHSINANTQIDEYELCVNTSDSHKETSLQEVLHDEDKKNPPRLYGSGMLVINTPWKLVQQAAQTLSFLERVLWAC